MAQVDYIRFDTDFFDKPKIKGLIHRQGQESVLLLIRLLCAMGRATDGYLSRDSWEAIGIECGLKLERTEEIVNYFLIQRICSGSLENLGNERVQQDQAALAKRREATRERVAKFRGKVELDYKSESCEPMVLPDPRKTQPCPIDTENLPSVAENIDPAGDAHLEIALEKLEAPGNQPWTRDSRFIGASRRPMKDYPLLWLAPHELADVIKKLEESDIPATMYRDLFLKAEARLKTYKSDSRSTSGVSVYLWLTGFLFDELLERTIMSTRLTKTKQGAQRYELRR